MKGYSFSWRDDQPPAAVSDYQRAARAALPRPIWSYLEGGAEDLVTLEANRRELMAAKLRQRALAGVAAPDLTGRIAGTALSMPIAIAPTGLSGLIHWQGDVALARAAEKAGTRSVLSTASSYTIEEVADATEQQHWFQLYPWGDHARVGTLIDRAAAAGYTALFVTVDVPIVGNREGERKTGMGVPLRLTPDRCLDMALHPRWLRSLLRHRRYVPVHFAEMTERETSGKRKEGNRIVAAMAARAVANQARFMQGDLHWDDLAWIRDCWKGPLYVKGILDPDDAERAIVSIGAQGVVVSNHGGRQLDRVPSTIEALGAVARRIAGRGEVYQDGGIRRGTDVAAALCHGADAVFVGRAALYGLATAGQDGVSRTLEILREELRRTLILMGCPAASALDRSWLHENCERRETVGASTVMSPLQPGASHATFETPAPEVSCI